MAPALAFLSTAIIWDFFLLCLSSPPHPPLLPNCNLLILQDKYGGTVKEEAKENLREEEREWLHLPFLLSLLHPVTSYVALREQGGLRNPSVTAQKIPYDLVLAFFFFFFFLMQCNDFNRLIPRRNPTQLGLSISLVWVRLLPELSGCSFFLCTLSNLTSSSLRSEHLGNRKCFSSVFSGLSSLSQWLFKNINGAQKIFFGVCMSDPRTFPNASSQRPCSTFSHQKLLFLIKKEDKFNWAYQLCSNIKFKTILN